MLDTLKRNNPCNSMAGIKAIYILDAELAQCKPTSAGISIQTDEVWTKIEARDATFESQHIDGNAYNNDINIIFYGVSNNYNLQFCNMTNRKWVVKKIDANGKAWLYGTNKEPLSFTWKDINDGMPDGQTCYNLSFNGLTTKPAMLTNN